MGVAKTEGGWAATMSSIGNTVGFSAPRKVVFADWRVAATHVALLAVTLYYCYVTAINAQGYLYKEIPTGDIALFASSAGRTTVATTRHSTWRVSARLSTRAWCFSSIRRRAVYAVSPCGRDARRGVVFVEWSEPGKTPLLRCRNRQRRRECARRA